MSNENDINDVELYGWQSDVMEMVKENESVRGEEAYQGVPDFIINKQLAINVVLPVGSGHTFLASYIAAKIPTILVYRDNKHLQSLLNEFELYGESETVSMYEIFYALYKPDVQQPSSELMEMSNRFSTEKAVVIDDSLRVPQQVKDFISQRAQGPLVILGH